MTVDPGSRGWNEHRHLDPSWIIQRDQGLLVIDAAAGRPTGGHDIPVNGTWSPFGPGNTFSGMLLFDETLALGQCALFLTGGTVMTLVSTASTSWSTVQGTAGKVNVSVAADLSVVVENKLTVAARVTLAAIRVRAAQ